MRGSGGCPDLSNSLRSDRKLDGEAADSACRADDQHGVTR
jgi:hypothetical protein